MKMLDLDEYTCDIHTLTPVELTGTMDRVINDRSLISEKMRINTARIKSLVSLTGKVIFAKYGNGPEDQLLSGLDEKTLSILKSFNHFPS